MILKHYDRQPKGRLSRIAIHYRGRNGDKLQGRGQREFIEIGIGDSGQWALVFRAPMIKPVSVGGAADSPVLAELAALAALPEFVRSLPVIDRDVRVPVSYGEANGGVIAQISK